MCGVCGVSGSGKSTFACDVIARYALNAFAMSIPSKMKRMLDIGKKPAVDEITNLPAVILIDIKNAKRQLFIKDESIYSDLYSINKSK